MKYLILKEGDVLKNGDQIKKHHALSWQSVELNLIGLKIEKRFLSNHEFRRPETLLNQHGLVCMCDVCVWWKEHLKLNEI